MQTKGKPMYGSLTLEDIEIALDPWGLMGEKAKRISAEAVALVLMNRFGITHADKELALYQILPKVDTGE